MFSLMPWRRERNGGTALANRIEHPATLFRTEFDDIFDRFLGNWSLLGTSWNRFGLGLDLNETEDEVTVAELLGTRRAGNGAEA